MNKAQFSSIGGVLGIKDALPEPGVFYGANSPKPPRATLRTATATQSSFYDVAKADTLAKAGWLLTRAGKTRGIKTAGKMVTVAVDTPRGYLYAWNITVGDKDMAIELGAEVPSNANLLVWGSFPKPPRASKIVGSGRASTFCPPSPTAIENAVTEGYTVEGLDGDWFN
jgi:hypothetical protein